MLTGLEPPELLDTLPLSQAVAKDQAAGAAKTCVCGKAFGPRVDGERKTIDGKEVCDDCYFDAIGANIEKRPIHVPSRRGPGGGTNLK